MEYLFSNVEEGTTNMLWPQLQIERNQKKKIHCIGRQYSILLPYSLHYTI